MRAVRRAVWAGGVEGWESLWLARIGQPGEQTAPLQGNSPTGESRGQTDSRDDPVLDDFMGLSRS